jgi:hypothetical protein
VPEAPPYAPHRCACPPLGGRATIEWPQWRLFTSTRTDEVASIGSVEVSTSCAHPQEVRQRDLVSDHTPTSGGSGSTRAARRSAARRSAADGDLRGDASKCQSLLILL